jgi:hypothetical protein
MDAPHLTHASLLQLTEGSIGQLIEQLTEAGVGEAFVIELGQQGHLLTAQWPTRAGHVGALVPTE